MQYPHRLVVNTPGEGPAVEDPETGEWTPPDDELVYDGAADVQEAGYALRRANVNAIPGTDAEGVAYLAVEKVVRTILPGMHATIYWQPGIDDTDTSDAEVVRVGPMDGSVHLSRI